MFSRALGLVAFAAFTALGAQIVNADPLPSWNNGATKDAIVEFVEAVTTPGSDSYVDPAERIATFDNDGNLWAEQPVYFQITYAIDTAKKMVAADPSLAEKSPGLKAAAEGDIEALLADGHKGLLEVMAASHAGMSTSAFKQSVADWFATSKHPKTGQRYDHMIYQPMLELLAYLRENGFKTYIVSGGGVEFMRPWTEAVYGIPPEQVVGSVIKLKYDQVDDEPVLMRLPEIDFIDDKEGKPVGIQTRIGRRPLVAFGNSDGDYEMLRWTTAGPGARLGVIVHHTDAEREYAYDRDATFGKLDRALDEAPQRGWVVIDMKSDWGAVLPGPALYPRP